MDQLPFIPNQVYNRRSAIHALYGGNQQSGISSSSTFPYIFIFSGKTGHQHGYHDSWLNDNVFSYTGEGQIGDMEFTRCNLALKDHKENGKRVFLFESEGRGFAKFKSEVEVFDADYKPGFDTAGNPRVAIVFFFNKKGVLLPIQPHLLNNPDRIGRKSYVEYELKPPNETERKGLVTSRVGQGFFRNCILHRWEYKCAVTGFEKRDVLIASHILPWAKSTNEERMDSHNGILLSPTYDALFDRHLISFEDSGKIILSDKIEAKAYNKIGVSGLETIKKLHSDNFYYLDKHRLHFNEKH